MLLNVDLAMAIGRRASTFTTFMARRMRQKPLQEQDPESNKRLLGRIGANRRAEELALLPPSQQHLQEGEPEGARPRKRQQPKRAMVLQH